MRFVALPPVVELSPYVDHYWFAEAGAGEAPSGAQFPAGGVAMLFNLGPPQALLDGPGGTPTWFDGAWVSGERARPYHLAAPDGARLLGVAFKPGGARPFFGVPLSELADRVVLLSDLWPVRLFAPMREEMLSVDAARAGAPAHLVRIAERTLLLRLDIARSVGMGLISAAVRRFAVLDSGASVRTVADDLGVSTRYLRRTFRDGVGIGPKVLHRVLRFQKLIGRIDAQGCLQGAEPDWSALAQTCGYFDQSHMIRDFRQFSGIRPTDYIGARSLDPNFAEGTAEPG